MRNKIQIRVPKRAAALDVGSAWRTTLEPAIQQIFSRDPSPQSYEKLYDTVYRLVVQEQGKQLYKTLIEFLRSHLNQKTCPAVGKSPVLAVIGREWTEWSVALTKIGDIFMYLNRSYCEETGLPRVDVAGLTLFREEILSASVQSHLYQDLVDQVSAERRGQLVDSAVAKTVTEMLESLSDASAPSATLYEMHAQPLIVESALTYYLEAVEKLINEESSQSIITTMTAWLNAESGRGVFYLPPETPAQLLQAIEQRIITPALLRIWDLPTGVDSWVETDNVTALKLAADLEMQCSPVNADSDSNLVMKVAQTATKMQLCVNETSKTPETWVSKTISVQLKLLKLANVLASSNDDSSKKRLIQMTISNALAQAANKLPRMPEFLAAHLDGLLRKSPSPRSDAEIESELDQALTLFDMLDEPDRFATFFKRQLARRLLQHRSRSEALEQSWIRRLRASDHGGPQYVFSFQRMMKDMQISQETNARWRQTLSTDTDIVKTNVNILARMVWPLQYFPAALPDIALPAQLDNTRRKFERWYSGQHFRRRLDWNMGLATVDVRINVGPGYTANMPTVTLTILNQFSGDQRLTVEELAAATQIPLGGELERYLLPLVNTTGRLPQLLIKEPNTSEIDTSDIVSFNQRFKSPTPRFRVQALAAKRAPGPSTEELQLEEDRLHKAQAAVVRVMKARRELSHSALIQETAGLLSRHFRAQPHTLKRAIQLLLDKDYLRRGPDPQIYEYVA